jgi:AsmA protein
MGNAMLKRILIGIGILVVLVIAAALIAPFLIPVDALRGQIEAQAQSATGRPLKIKGAFRFSLLPSLALEANDVSFGNAPGAKDANMATFKQLVIQLKLFPLLHGGIEVDRFVLVDPQINLEVDKNGVGNWVFAKTGGMPQKPGAGQPAAGGGGFSGAADIRLGEVKLDGGRISYRDDRTGVAYSLDKIAMTVKLPDMDSPFGLDGQFDWNGQTIKLAAKGNALGKILANQGSPLALSITSQPVTLAFDGKLGKLQPATLDGAVKLSVPSLRKLADWAGSPMPPGQGFGPLSIEGKLALAGKRISFSNAALSLDDMKGKGEVNVDTSGVRPLIQAKLALDHLNLNNYMSKAQPAATAPATTAPAAGKAPAGPPGKTAASDWSDEPIDLAPLKTVDADLAFSVGGIEVQKIKIGKSRLETKLKDGLLTANLAELNLYEGKGQGQVELNGRGAVPALKADFKLADVQAEPLLKDAADTDRLSGKGSFDFQGAASGKSQRALVSALNGKGKFAFHDGAIKGLNLAAMVRNISTAFLDAKAGETQKTDFSSLAGTYTITNGILSNKDLEMISPLLRVTGSGAVDMPKRTINYRVVPKVVASTTGQGGAFGKAGVAVPVLVTGRWDDIHYAPDLASGAVEEVKGAVKGLIPGGSSGSSGSGGSSGGTLPNPGKLLNKLFGN